MRYTEALRACNDCLRDINDSRDWTLAKSVIAELMVIVRDLDERLEKQERRRLWEV